MKHDIQHPQITWAEKTGYPSYMQEDYGEDAEGNNDAYEAYCDWAFEERREIERFGE